MRMTVGFNIITLIFLPVTTIDVILTPANFKVHTTIPFNLDSVCVIIILTGRTHNRLLL